MTTQPLTVATFYENAVEELGDSGLSFGHGSDCAEDEAAWLITATMDLPFDELDKSWSHIITPEIKETLDQRLYQRCTEKTPLAYILGEAWLGPYPFKVDPRTIIPRSFIAELLMDELVPWISDPKSILHIADVCTGSGCLAIIAGLYFPNAQIDAIDLSPDALAVAEENRAIYDMESRIRLHEGDLMAPVANQTYDLIISNPPYVDTASMNELPLEYRHEPEMALAGGEDGLDLVHKLIRQAATQLNPGGWLLVEIGHNRDRVEAAYPKLPLIWLDTAGGSDFVFLIDQESLQSLA